MQSKGLKVENNEHGGTLPPLKESTNIMRGGRSCGSVSGAVQDGCQQRNMQSMNCANQTASY